MTKAEREYMSKLVDTGCALCRWLGTPGTPAQVHHVRTGTGIGRRSSHFDTIPLCYEHHQGASGIHGMGRRAWEREYGITEVELMEFSRECIKHCLTLL